MKTLKTLAVWLAVLTFIFLSGCSTLSNKPDDTELPPPVFLPLPPDSPLVSKQKSPSYPPHLLQRPVVLSDRLDINESTAAPGLTDDERLERMVRSVVQISAPNMSGSGVLIDNQNCIVATNNHVVGRFYWVEVSTIRYIRPDGSEFLDRVLGDVVGVPNSEDDLALVQLENCDGLPWAYWQHSKPPQRGGKTTAIGHPGGLFWTSTVGQISHPSRFQVNENEGFATNSGFGFIQTDADIDGGSSGGGLFNASGDLVGINSMIRFVRSVFPMVRSIQALQNYLNHAALYGQVYRHSFAMMVVPILDGENAILRVVSTTSGGGADRHGLKPGDVITAVNGEPFWHLAGFNRATRQDLDNIVTLTVENFGYEREVDISFFPQPPEKMINIDLFQS